MPKLFIHGNALCSVLYYKGEPVWFNSGTLDRDLAKVAQANRILELRNLKNGLTEKALWKDVKEAFFIHLRAQRRSKRSLETYLYAFKRLEEQSPITYFRELDKQKIDNICLSWKGLKESSLNRYICCYKKMCSWAVGQFADKNQLKGYPKFSVPNVVNDRYFAPLEVKRILDSATGPIKSVMYLCAYAGLSPSDARPLKWSQVDFGRNEITYHRAKIAQRTPHAVRPPLNDKLKKYLLGLKRNSDYICSDDGKVMRPDMAAKQTKVIMIKNGFPEGYTLYTLRHTFISQMIMQGIDSSVVAAWVGHLNNNQIRSYMHLSPSFKKQNINKLPY